MDERPHDDTQPQPWPAEPDPEAEHRRTAAHAQWNSATPPTPWWRQPGPAILLGALVIAAGIGTGIAVAGSGGGSAPVAASASPSPSPIDLHGTLTIPFLGTDLLSPNAKDTESNGAGEIHIGDTCATLGGYTDISEGAAVTVGGDKGQTLTVGALREGTVTGQAGQAASCEFGFDVQVPGGLPLYTVTISHRGTQTFTPDQVAAGIQLTLGQQ